MAPVSHGILHKGILHAMSKHLDLWHQYTESYDTYIKVLNHDQAVACEALHLSFLHPKDIIQGTLSFFI